jgi:hypothetical protein
MSRPFRITLAAPPKDLAAILLDAEEPLANMGFRRRRTLTRSELEQEAGGESAEIRSLLRDAPAMRDWRGAYVCYFRSEFELGVVFYHWLAGFIDAYVDVERSVLGRLFAAGAASQLYAPVVALARAMGAAGGVGASALPLDPLPPSMVPSAFFDNPANPGAPCMFGLFRPDSISRQQFEALQNDDYSIRQESGYLLVEDRDFAEILGDSYRRAR